jgi:SAM-dependent methyltransferase
MFVSLPRVFDVTSWALQAFWLRRFRAIEDVSAYADDHLKTVHGYNAGVTAGKVITSTRRAEPVYRIAALPGRDLGRERILIVGPRNAQEFLVAWLYGFSWSRMEAIDLYSTHPKIRVMDMHDMTFADASFDLVTMVNTLGYASELGRVIRQVERILRPGGRFCFSHAHWPESQTFAGDRVSAASVIEMCHEAGLETYHHHSFFKTNSSGGRQRSHFIGMQKPGPTA